ncbi:MULTISPECIES: hypothetical protein [Salinibaculum]|uniref:hypothetical protein n=1 Tax=Salinibaculum TaxID=2732368 RepID=UPI0030CBEF41
MDDGLRDAIDSLTQDQRDALREAIADDPRALAEWLLEEGYLDPETVTQGASHEPTADLTPAQEELLSLVERMGQPRSAGEVVEYVSAEEPDFQEQYSSANHRTWMSKQLNTLVGEGVIGRYRKGRTVKYTPSVEEAIRRWALEQSRFVEELERDEARAIAEDTGMPRGAVRRALVGLLDDA